MSTNIKHLGFIMDGNRRWAKEKKLPTLLGHKKGYETAINVVKWCVNRGIKVITLYAFSTENWNRSKEEISYLMELSEKAVKEQINELHKKEIKVQYLGRLTELSKKLQKIFTEAMALTKNNKKATLNMAFNYGGQPEIIDAINGLIKKGIRNVTPEILQKFLYDPDMPAPDLIIRTSGEMRTSGFLLWEAAYSELYFTKTYWPAFSEKDLDLAIESFNHRQRRFGG